MEMEEINIEDIMAAIRAEIKEKGYTSDMLSFNDIVVDTIEINIEKFDKVKFNEELYAMNTLWNVQPDHPLNTAGGFKSRITIFIKKIIRKMIRFYVEPITMDQDTFNATIVRSFNLINCYIAEQASHPQGKIGKEEEMIKNLSKQNIKLREEIRELQEEQEALKKDLFELKNIWTRN